MAHNQHTDQQFRRTGTDGRWSPVHIPSPFWMQILGAAVFIFVAVVVVL